MPTNLLNWNVDAFVGNLAWSVSLPVRVGKVPLEYNYLVGEVGSVPHVVNDKNEAGR